MPANAALVGSEEVAVAGTKMTQSRAHETREEDLRGMDWKVCVPWIHLRHWLAMTFVTEDCEAISLWIFVPVRRERGDGGVGRVNEGWFLCHGAG